MEITPKRPTVSSWTTRIGTQLSVQPFFSEALCFEYKFGVTVCRQKKLGAHGYPRYLGKTNFHSNTQHRTRAKIIEDFLPLFFGQDQLIGLGPFGRFHLRQHNHEDLSRSYCRRVAWLRPGRQALCSCYARDLNRVVLEIFCRNRT